MPGGIASGTNIVKYYAQEVQLANYELQRLGHENIKLMQEKNLAAPDSPEFRQLVEKQTKIQVEIAQKSSELAAMEQIFQQEQGQQKGRAETKYYLG